LGCLALSTTLGQQSGSSEGAENDLDHAVKVADDALWHLELDGIAEVRLAVIASTFMLVLATVSPRSAPSVTPACPRAPPPEIRSSSTAIVSSRKTSIAPGKLL
jgi:hypothetical protein